MLLAKEGFRLKVLKYLNNTPNDTICLKKWLSQCFWALVAGKPHENLIKPDIEKGLYMDFETEQKLAIADGCCGARGKRSGRPCRRRDLYNNYRCPLHGGLSTGPRTAEGKRKSAMNGFRNTKAVD